MLIFLVGLATLSIAFYHWRHRCDEETTRQRLETEISERTIKLEESLVAVRQSEERFVIAMEACSDGLWDWDVPTGGAYFSPSYFRMLGYEPDEVTHDVNAWINLIHPDDLTNTLSVGQECIDNLRHRIDVEFRMRTKDGSWKWILGRGRAVSRDTNGRALRIVGTNIDITERKLVESELQAAKFQAETALATLRETQTALIQTTKMAALGQLTAGIAHEINTPIGVILTAITHCLEIVKTASDAVASGTLRKSQIIGILNEINETGTLLLSNVERTVDLVRSFQRVSADQVSGERRVFDLSNQLKEIVISLRPEWQNRGHNFDICCPESLYLDSYPGAFSQIITNFVINSVTHGYKDGKQGTLRISVTKQGDREFQLIYSDDGNGIPKKSQDRVFEPFYTTNRCAGNTGLGLHIVYNIVTNSLGGSISLESDPLMGTFFTIKAFRKSPANQKDSNEA
ncbi:MAG: PAS domain-containing sensor histidine kinase [Rhodospirillaceae bacterium]